MGVVPPQTAAAPVQQQNDLNKGVNMSKPGQPPAVQPQKYKTAAEAEKAKVQALTDRFSDFRGHWTNESRNAARTVAEDWKGPVTEDQYLEAAMAGFNNRDGIADGTEKKARSDLKTIEDATAKLADNQSPSDLVSGFNAAAAALVGHDKLSTSEAETLKAQRTAELAVKKAGNAGMSADDLNGLLKGKEELARYAVLVAVEKDITGPGAQELKDLIGAEKDDMLEAEPSLAAKLNAVNERVDSLKQGVALDTKKLQGKVDGFDKVRQDFKAEYQRVHDQTVGAFKPPVSKKDLQAKVATARAESKKVAEGGYIKEAKDRLNQIADDKREAENAVETLFNKHPGLKKALEDSPQAFAGNNNNTTPLDKFAAQNVASTTAVKNLETVLDLIRGYNTALADASRDLVERVQQKAGRTDFSLRDYEKELEGLPAEAQLAALDHIDLAARKAAVGMPVGQQKDFEAKTKAQADLDVMTHAQVQETFDAADKKAQNMPETKKAWQTQIDGMEPGPEKTAAQADLTKYADDAAVKQLRDDAIAEAGKLPQTLPAYKAAEQRRINAMPGFSQQEFEKKRVDLANANKMDEDVLPSTAKQDALVKANALSPSIPKDISQAAFDAKAKAMEEAEKLHDAVVESQERASAGLSHDLYHSLSVAPDKSIVQYDEKLQGLSQEAKEMALEKLEKLNDNIPLQPNPKNDPTIDKANQELQEHKDKEQKLIDERFACAEHNIPFVLGQRSQPERRLVAAQLAHDAASDQAKTQAELEAAKKSVTRERNVRSQPEPTMGTVVGTPAATTPVVGAPVADQGQQRLDELTKQHGGSVLDWRPGGRNVVSRKLSFEAATSILTDAARGQEFKSLDAIKYQAVTNRAFVQPTRAKAAEMLRDNARRLDDTVKAMGADLEASKAVMDAPATFDPSKGHFVGGVRDRIEKSRLHMEDAAHDAAMVEVLEKGKPPHPGLAVPKDRDERKEYDAELKAFNKEVAAVQENHMMQYREDVKDLHSNNTLFKSNIRKMEAAYQDMLEVKEKLVDKVSDKLVVNLDKQQTIEEYQKYQGIDTEAKFATLSSEEQDKALISFAKRSAMAGEPMSKDEINDLDIPYKDKLEVREFTHKVGIEAAAKEQKAAQQAYNELQKTEPKDSKKLKEAGGKLVKAKSSYMAEIQGLRSAQAEKMAMLTEGKQALKAELRERASGNAWKSFKTSLSIQFNTNDELAALRKEQKALQKEMLESAKAMDKVVNPYLKARADFVDAKKEVETKLERVEKKATELETKVKAIADPEHKKIIDAKQDTRSNDRGVHQVKLDRTRKVQPQNPGQPKAVPKGFGKKFDAGTLITSAENATPQGSAAAGGGTPSSTTTRTARPPRTRRQQSSGGMGVN